MTPKKCELFDEGHPECKAQHWKESKVKGYYKGLFINKEEGYTNRLKQKKG